MQQLPITREPPRLEHLDVPADGSANARQSGNTFAEPPEFWSSPAKQKTINLALQGGGSHGAFTWGVLDRLLEDPRLAIDGITATSAGSINAVVLAYGLSIGGRKGQKRLCLFFGGKCPQWQHLASSNHQFSIN